MDKKDMGFVKWLRRSCEYGDLMPLVVIMCILMFSALILLWPLFLALGATFGIVLCWRWRRDVKNPPWYLRGREVKHGRRN